MCLVCGSGAAEMGIHNNESHLEKSHFTVNTNYTLKTKFKKIISQLKSNGPAFLFAFTISVIVFIFQRSNFKNPDLKFSKYKYHIVSSIFKIHLFTVAVVPRRRDNMILKVT